MTDYEKSLVESAEPVRVREMLLLYTDPSPHDPPDVEYRVYFLHEMDDEQEASLLAAYRKHKQKENGAYVD